MSYLLTRSIISGSMRPSPAQPAVWHESHYASYPVLVPMTESASHFDQPVTASQPSGDETLQVGLPNQPRCIRSEEILQGENEALILHGGAVYRLRHTKSGKLILNK